MYFLTVIEMDMCSFNSDEPEEIRFIADHPFIIYITAWGESGLNVLFSGKFAPANQFLLFVVKIKKNRILYTFNIYFFI